MSRLVLGIMSGTSADGIDVAAVRIAGRGQSMRPRFVSHLHRPFAPDLRQRILQVMAPAATRTEHLARLHADLGEAFAAAAITAIRKLPGRPELIGLAGQTICHLPAARGKTVTWQLGDPARVAARTGIPTVAEFRQSDVAAGGQGAPLVPWTDLILFGSASRARAVQNIGGIANVTWLPAAAKPQDVIAFDTGPGNMIIDGLIANITRGRESFDRNGRRAARGRVLPAVLNAWLKHPFLRKPPPKTTGRETFGRRFIDAQMPRLRAAGRSPDDWIATATAFTAHSIARAITPLITKEGQILSPLLTKEGLGEVRKRSMKRNQKHAVTKTREPLELILCGGGARNATLSAMLAGALPGVIIRSIDTFGIPAEAKEAVSFAILAAAHADGAPANLPQVTGAGRPTLLGSLVRPSG